MGTNPPTTNPMVEVVDMSSLESGFASRSEGLALALVFRLAAGEAVLVLLAPPFGGEGCPWAELYWGHSF